MHYINLRFTYWLTYFTF